MVVLLLCCSAFAQVETPDNDDPLAREEYIKEKRGGDAPDGARLAAIQELEALIRQQQQLFLSDPNSNIAANPSAWTFIGPSHTTASANTSGRVTAIAVDPTDSNVVYAGGAQGGVWKSTDAGLNWAPLTDDQVSLAIGSIAIDPNNHNVIYVGTGEQNYSSDSYYGGGILKSSDGGSTWTRLTNSNFDGSGTRANGGFPAVGAMAVQPGVSGTPIVLAAVRSSTGGIYYSQDGGTTWVKAAGMPASLSAANSVVYVSSSVVYAGLYANGVYKSTDGGLTWAAANGNATGGVITITGTQRSMIGASKADANTVYAALTDSASGGNNLNGFYKTTDGGLTWTKFAVATGGFVDFCTPQCWYDLVVAVNPVNASKVFLGGSAVSAGNNVLYSGDGGTSWAGKGAGIHVDHHAAAFDATGATMFWGSDGGIYKTTGTSGLTSAALTWTNLNSNIGITQFYAGIAINPADPTITYGGAQDNGVQRFSNNLIWDYVTCGDGAGAVVDGTTPTTVYANCQNIDVRKSTTGLANSFSNVTSGKITTERVQFIAPMAGDDALSNPTRVYFGTFRLWMTADGGTTWTAISPDLTGGSGTITNITVSAKNKDVVYTVSTDGKVQKTTNATQAAPTFTNITGTGLPAGRLNAVAIDPADDTVAYVVAANFTAGQKVFKLAAGATAWTNITGDLPNSPANDILIDPDLPNTMYVATDVGVLKSINGGTNWIPLATSFPRVAALGLQLHRASRILRVSTHGRGLWDLSIPVSTVLSASPATVTFASQTINTTSPAGTVTLTAQNGSVTISGITITGDFAKQTTCGSSLASGSSCTVTVTFTPTVAGTRTGALSIATNLAGSPTTVSLSGSGISNQPAVSVSPASLSFGSLNVGTSSAGQAVTVSNTGSAVLNISSIAVTPSDYSRTTTCGATLAVGANCSVTVTFAPTTSGVRTGTLNVNDDAVGSPHNASLSGTGLGPAVSFSPTPLSFGNQNVGTSSAAKSVTVTNGGNATLNISSLAVSPADYTSTSTCGATLAAAASCTVSITFAPSTGTSIPGTLTLTDNASGSPHVLAISGTGVSATASVSTNSLTFAAQNVGSTSAAQTVTLTNSGNGPLTISGITISGDYQQTTTCGASLASASSCTVSVTFSPTAGGTRTGSLTITDNAGGSPRTVSLTGSGLAGVVSLSPASLTFAPQTAGTTSSPQTVTLSNTGNGTLTLSNINTVGDFQQTNSCGLSLASGASCTFSVVFAPTVGDAISGSIVITDNAAGSPHSIALSGTGVLPSGVSLSETTVAFPGQTVSTGSTAHTVTLFNSSSKYGGSVLNITGITVNGDFQMSTACPSSMAIDSNCPITVAFVPTATGTRNGLVTITDSASGTPRTVSLTGIGQAPSVSISPASLTFGTTNAGTSSAAQNVTLSNTGNATLSISGIATSGDFQQTSTCGVTLAAGASCTISVTFQPTAGGTLNGSLTVTDNAGGSPRTVTLSGTGVVPAGASISPSSLTFANQLVGTTSSPMIVNLSNAATKFGSSILNISSITITGDFQKTSGCGTQLAAGASCSISVTFNPTTGGSRTGTLTITDSGSGSPRSVQLSGNGVAPIATLSVGDIAFGNQSVGVTSAPQNVVLTNTGTAALNMSAIAVSGAAFAQTNNCGTSLAASFSCTISLTFTPSASGLASGTLSITDDAAGSPQTLNLSGNGVVLSASASPASLVYGSQRVGTSSQAQTVTLTNTGNTALTIGSIVTSAEFAQTTKCTSTLAAGASCSIAVKFSPAANGTRTGTLTITTNAPSSPQVVTLSGTGTGGKLALSAADVSFGIQIMGSQSVPAHVLTLSNLDNTTLDIQTISVSSTDFLVAHNCASMLLAGQSCTISVSIRPDAVGVLNGILTVTSNNSDAAMSAISGNVVDFALRLARPLRGSRNSIPAGATAQYAVEFASSATLPQAPVLTCSDGPANSQCSLLAIPSRNGSISGAVVTLQTERRRSARLRNGASSGTPAGKYNLMVTASVGGAKRSLNIPVEIY